MVSQRQRVARKRFKEAHPELFPTPDPTPPKDPSQKKKKKKNQGTNKNPKSLDPTKKSKFKKHPLRVPGLKPGESCFICKDKGHVAKLCPKKAEWEKNKICLLCRQRGHSLKNCPNKSDEVVDKKLCYNCGGTGHSLSNCPQPLQDGGTKYASCFICKEHGHLSKNCPKNTHGIYPKGGCCKICGGVTHLAKDCPRKGNKASGAFGVGAKEEEARPRVTKLVSGDELEDDFMVDNNGSDKKKSGKRKGGATPGTGDSEGKAKKKQGPTVVNFVG